MKYLIFLLSKLFCNYSELVKNIEEAITDNYIKDVYFKYSWISFSVRFESIKDVEIEDETFIVIKFNYFNSSIQNICFVSANLEKVETIEKNTITSIKKQVGELYNCYIVKSHLSGENIICIDNIYSFSVRRKGVHPHIKVFKKLKIEDL